MNPHITSMLKSLRENYNIQDEDELEEASNSTDAYAGGEGPQRTPHAFGGSDEERKRKFARKSAAYEKPAEDTNLWFVKAENIYRKIADRIDEIEFEINK